MSHHLFKPLRKFLPNYYKNDEEAGIADAKHELQLMAKKYCLLSLLSFAVALSFCISCAKIVIRSPPAAENTFQYFPSHENDHVTLVGMMSINRNINGENPYIYKTISSVLPALSSNATTSTYSSYNGEPMKIHVFVGNLDNSYLEFFKYNKQIKIMEMKADEWAPIEDKSLKEKHFYNFYRMVKYLINLAEDELLRARNNNSSLKSLWTSTA